MRYHKVVIIGAGVAGCTAARTLIQNGIHDIVVLEATDRIGGRVKTFHHGVEGGKLELGAQWIHGNVGNPLYKELDSRGLLIDRGEYLGWEEFTVEKKHLYQLSQAKISQPTFQKGFDLYKLVGERLVTDQYCTEDVNSFSRSQFEGVCEQQGLDPSQRNIYWKVVRWIYNADRCVEGDDCLTPIQSYFPSPFDDCGGKNYSFTSGANSIFRELLLPLIEDKIELRSHVTSVEWAQRGTVCVRTDSGQQISADHVIVTPSLGYIKQHYRELFHPPLPEEKQQAISLLRIGSIEKLLLTFESPFWACTKDCAFSGYGLLADEQDEIQLSRLIQPILGCQTDWWKGLVSLDTVATSPDILVGWLAGRSAVDSTEYTDTQIVEVVLKLLSTYTGLQPAIASTRLYRGKWATDEHFLGSYSIPSNPALSAQMMHPVFYNGKPVILFAGEAYHHKWMSTLHGAYDTGVQQANVISSQ